MVAEDFVGTVRSYVESTDVEPLRREEYAVFERLGLPTVRHEEWKYTNLLPRLTPALQIPTSTSHADVDETIRQASERFGFTAHQIVLVNGVLAPSLSSLPDGVTVVPSLTSASPRDAELIHAASASRSQDHAIAALGAALAPNVVVVRVAKDTALTMPLHVVRVIDARNGAPLTSTRMVVDVEEFASVDIIDSVTTIGESATFSPNVLDITVHPEAKASWTLVVDDTQASANISYATAHVHRSAVFTSNTFCLGGGFVRNDLVIRLVGQQAEAYLNGLSVLHDAEFADNHTVVDHAVPHCHSDELYKGVYDGTSTGVFNGKIFVRKDAQKTLAYQSNRSLLLSSGANINAKPQLEIFADDVKCSHGATMGQLDDEAMFYLRSRGIGENDARAILTYAFAADIIERVSNAEVRTYLTARLAERLGSEMLSA